MSDLVIGAGSLCKASSQEGMEVENNVKSEQPAVLAIPCLKIF